VWKLRDRMRGFRALVEQQSPLLPKPLVDPGGAAARGDTADARAAACADACAPERQP